LLVLDALHSTPLRRYLSAERVPMGLLPLGYPARGRWAQPERRPVEEVVHWNR
jgi:nitroreductase